MINFKDPQLREKLKKFASLAVKVGVNIQKGQMLVINSSVEAYEFTRILVEEAYLAGAGLVQVLYGDIMNNRLAYQYASDEYLFNYPKYEIQRYEYLLEQGAARLSIVSPNPQALAGLDSQKIAKESKIRAQALDFYQKKLMASSSQWSLIAWPNEIWAQTVFKGEKPEVAIAKLLDAILYASRVTDQNDPIEEWNKHLATLTEHYQILNDYRFESLHFKNSLGTDLTVGLVDNHLWAGGSEVSQKNVVFVPNIPTEEVFCMPHKMKVNGKVVATKPLNYQGRLIEDFYLEFKDGQVINYDAKKEKDTLKCLLEMDEGSKHLGEVALISHHSPISNLNILFYNTLFDENASCHLALGNAYTNNIKDGNDLSEEQLEQAGFNKSINHVDFMFGSEDMEVTGLTKDGQEIPIFRKGNFVF